VRVISYKHLEKIERRTHLYGLSLISRVSFFLALNGSRSYHFQVNSRERWALFIAILCYLHINGRNHEQGSNVWILTQL